jgi:hypothetical protein
MALINCYECQKEISNMASSCPNCGAPVHEPSAAASVYISNPTKGKDEIIIGFMLLLACGVWGYLKFYTFAGICGFVGLICMFRGKFLRWYHWK